MVSVEECVKTFLLCISQFMLKKCFTSPGFVRSPCFRLGNITQFFSVFQYTVYAQFSKAFSSGKGQLRVLYGFKTVIWKKWAWAAQCRSGWEPKLLWNSETCGRWIAQFDLLGALSCNFHISTSWHCSCTPAPVAATRAAGFISDLINSKSVL